MWRMPRYRCCNNEAQGRECVGCEVGVLIEDTSHPGGPADRDRLAMDLQQRAPQHGDWRHYTRPKTEDGRLKSASVPR